MASNNEEVLLDEKDIGLKLECPFTWEMDDVDSSGITDFVPRDGEEIIPLLNLMRLVMKIYIQTKDEKDENDILENIEKCEEIKSSLYERESEDFCGAVHHIVQATKYHALRKLGKSEEAETIFKKIKALKSTNKIEKSTINACRAIAWSTYLSLGTEKALEYTRKALEDSDYHIWHFTLGVYLRRKRREEYWAKQPDEEEQKAFLKAYELEPQNIIYGIFVALMHKESRENRDEQRRIYEKILETETITDTIYLRLAFGFMSLDQLPQAERCLDEVADSCSNDSMYLHYRGKYYMKQNEINQAATFFKKAADMGNYPASMDYIRCMGKLNKSYDATDDLLLAFNKSTDMSNEKLQGLLADIAFSYLNRKDMKNALKYFLECIERDPQSDCLKQHRSILLSGEPLNIYYELENDVFLTLKIQQKRDKSLLDNSIVDIYNKLKNYCDENRKNELSQFVREGVSRSNGMNKFV